MRRAHRMLLFQRRCTMHAAICIRVRASDVQVIYVITFRVSRRPREMYCGYARLCVCLYVCPRPHAHTIARTRM